MRDDGAVAKFTVTAVQCAAPSSVTTAAVPAVGEAGFRVIADTSFTTTVTGAVYVDAPSASYALALTTYVPRGRFAQV